MLKHPKIKYHYEFSDLPINDNDIQALYGKLDYIADNIVHYMSEEYYELLSQLDIFVSDDTPTRTYGKYDTQAVLQDIYIFRDEYPDSHFSGLLADIAGILRCNIEENTLANIKGITEYAEEMLSNHDYEEHSRLDGISKAKQIVSKLKNLKITTPLLGEYDCTKNKVTLYIYNIVDYFSQAPNNDEALKIKTGLEIVLAHEVFHAIHFYRIGYDQAQREAKWNATPRRMDYRNCVIEGLARCSEYAWCEANQHLINIYQWHKDKIDFEMENYLYPGWPYAAAKAFIKNGNINRRASREVFQMSLHYCDNHWGAAYKILVDYDNGKV